MRTITLTDEQFESLYQECVSYIVDDLKEAAKRESKTTLWVFNIEHNGGNGYDWKFDGLPPLSFIWEYNLGIGSDSNSIQQSHDRDEKIRVLNLFSKFFESRWKSTSDITLKMIRNSTYSVSATFCWSKNP
jgi:hypothetical protein